MRNPYINLIMNSYRFAKDKRKYFVLCIIFFVIANAIYLLQPFLFGQLLNIIQKGGPDMFHDFTVMLLLYSVIPFFFWIFHGNGRIMERLTAFHISKNFKEYIFETVTKMPFKWHADNHSGETINKINKATNALERFSDEQFVYIETIIRFFGSLVGIAVISYYLSIYLAISTVFVVIIILMFDSKLVKQYDEIFKKEHKVASLLHDYVSNIRTVITLHFENLAKNELVRKIFDMFPVKKKNFILNEFKWFSVNMFISALEFGAIFAYGYYTFGKEGAILIGNLVILFQYLDKFTGTFFNFAWQYETIVKLNSELLTSEYIVNDYLKLHAIDKAHQVEDWQEIRIEGLNFKYDTKQKSQTLKNISLSIRKGEKIAFVGESGSGKSTMLSIIKGLYETDDLSISVDGKIYANSNILSNITTLIPQDPEIFENTLGYNVTFGIEADENEINRSIALARFDNVLKRLKRGLETNIKEKGVNLSGGEKQRLALARGIFSAQGRSIIILDEPTSSVDSVNELAIYKNIFSEFNDKCIISSIHKLHLLPMFDKIYLFDNGEIIESGTFDGLMKQGGTLKTTWDSYMQSNSES
ncbi:MAG: ABC transporter ATP-binding protein [Candidatus Gracilibacteria bacterium]|nr:ABC transporter ATP-binding protein [Candidatus Gracilibacteria bacterium]